MFTEMVLRSREELQPVLAAKLNRSALKGGVPEIYNKSFDLVRANCAYSRPPAVDVASLTYLTLSECAAVGIHSSMAENTLPHPERTEVYTEVGKDIGPLLEYFNGAVPIEHVGIYFSEHIRNLYSGENPTQYLVSPTGAAQILVESQITYGLVLDGALCDQQVLKQYGLLFLANTACLSQQDTEAIAEYVRDGGNLVVTGETSLFDENGRFRGEFLLGDVLSV